MSPDGKLLNVETQSLNMNLKKERYDDIKKRGLLFTKVIEPVENASHLRIVVVDRATGNVGSLQIPMKAQTVSK